MIKSFSAFILLGATSILYAQNISSYEYISVPTKFTDKKINAYNLGLALSKALQTKKYKVVSDIVSEWPTELQQNPCNVLKANIADDSSWLRNKVLLEFKDCNDKVVATSKGDSDEKEYEIGFPDALKKALTPIKLSSPDPSKITAKTENVVPVTTNANAVATSTTSVTASTSATFTDGSVHLQKVNTSDNQFILVKPNSSQPYASFTESGKQGLYKVVLEGKVAAFGYFENGNIVLEIPQKDGNFIKQVFTGK